MNTLRSLPEIGESVFLYTYLNIRQDAMDLFGFYDEKELHCFRMLLSISGVGSKAALSILSETTPGDFGFAVASGDVKTLTQAQGIGTKTAQRIILELKDKISSDQNELSSSASIPAPKGSPSEALEALMVLGYSRAEALSAVGKCDASLSAEEIIRQSLRLLAKT